MLETEVNLIERLEKLLENNSVDIVSIVDKASDVVAPVWPLKNFIACNPLLGLEARPFEDAVHTAKMSRALCAYDELNRYMISWCAAYLDEGQAALEMPRNSDGFYATWSDLIGFDARFLEAISTKKSWFTALPQSASEVVLYCLKALNVPVDSYEDYIRSHFASLAGFAGYIKWKSESGASEKKSISLMQYLAVRLAMSHLLDLKVESAPASESIDLESMFEREKVYRQMLIKSIQSQNPPQVTSNQVQAQVVFCIDVRSGSLRKWLESFGNIETYGFAGFFGLPLSVKKLDGHSFESYPALLSEGYRVSEKPVSNEEYWTGRYERANRVLDIVRRLYGDLKYNFATTFALAEMLGSICGALMLFRTASCRISAKVKSWYNTLLFPQVATKPDLSSLSFKTQLEHAENALKMMGLVQNFSPIVVICGHASCVQNTPYASVLDCGACGANHGGFNARVFVEICNRTEIREALRLKNIDIPAETRFLAALHNTVTDELTLYDADFTDSGIQNLQDTIEKASKLTAIERAKSHYGASEAVLRSANWAEVRPEWGLARNAAFVVGPRSLTKNIDLDGRVFLHSYEWEDDPSGKYLEVILTAPLVVAEWINMQYLFSSLDPVIFGSGSKITHNVVGKFGVMQGNASDLMHGLPLQSLKRQDTQDYHEPMRLLAIVHAPRERIKAIVDRHEVLQRLVYNGWISLVCIEQVQDEVYELDRNGRWNYAKL